MIQAPSGTVSTLHERSKRESESNSGGRCKGTASYGWKSDDSNLLHNWISEIVLVSSYRVRASSRSESNPGAFSWVACGGFFLFKVFVITAIPSLCNHPSSRQVKPNFLIMRHLLTSPHNTLETHTFAGGLTP